ncbi:MAG: S24 family peptidase [Bacteroidales bacterium]|nr:S24 family peptidase [Bacteroidales bacterium]
MSTSFNLQQLHQGSILLPFYEYGVSAGLPKETPASNNATIEVPSILVANPETTYVGVVSGDSMIGAGLDTGDYIFVDTSRVPHNGDVVSAMVNGEQLVKYFVRDTDGTVRLIPANPRYEELVVTPSDDLVVQGVVVQVMKRIRRYQSTLRPLGAEQCNIRIERSGRVVLPFTQCFVDPTLIPTLMPVFHALIDPVKGKRVAMVIQCAIEMGLISRPSFGQLKREFPGIGVASSFSGWVDYPHFYPEDKEAIKTRFTAALQAHPTKTSNPRKSHQ